MGNRVSNNQTLSLLQMRILRHLTTVERASGSDFIKTFTRQDMRELEGVWYPKWVRSFRVMLRVNVVKLYPDLSTLEESDLIDSEWEDQRITNMRAKPDTIRNEAGRVPRKLYYLITDHGMQALEENT